MKQILALLCFVVALLAWVVPDALPLVDELIATAAAIIAIKEGL
jgi:hypothetical protein